MKWAYAKSKGLLNLGGVTRIDWCQASPSTRPLASVQFVYESGGRDSFREDFYVSSTSVAATLFVLVMKAIVSDAVIIDMDVLKAEAERAFAEVDIG